MNGAGPLFEPALWCALEFAEQRTLLADAMLNALGDSPGVRGATVERGPGARAHDLTAVLETDVGLLRTPLWSQARSEIFCDASVHADNRRQLAPGIALREAVERLRARVAVPFALEARGLTLKLELEPGVERSWTAERSLFRGGASVTREDRIARPGDLDLRDLLAHFYTGPALRLVASDGSAFLLPAASDSEEGALISLCHGCQRWEATAEPRCSACGRSLELVSVGRPPRR